MEETQARTATAQTPIESFSITTDHVLLPQTCLESNIRVGSKKQHYSCSMGTDRKQSKVQRYNGSASSQISRAPGAKKRALEFQGNARTAATVAHRDVKKSFLAYFQPLVTSTKCIVLASEKSSTDPTVAIDGIVLLSSKIDIRICSQQLQKQHSLGGRLDVTK
jgi:hypothetical protein